ncbi:hypothetical protein [Ornithinibacillus halophilus]|uniref:Uncharacterized protein n=1 Tax=Ornithinibacillus halophilus TaxID=930117 RepID=A0A1M5N5Z7_9BACI|nr:hypothetical protein [Ornithinibacillus halophilus]SHG85010.1 hypothetical protein SAMN05216225_10714 [Ornithinibacillus halophilus]
MKTLKTFFIATILIFVFAFSMGPASQLMSDPDYGELDNKSV